MNAIEKNRITESVQHQLQDVEADRKKSDTCDEVSESHRCFEAAESLLLVSVEVS